MEREKFASRLGFVLISAGCAIGIGNVWRFPYITGQNGGGFFVLFYIFFLVVLGIPILTMEFSVGRASRRSAVKACQQLEKPGQKWHLHGIIAVAGNYLLMMFYTVVTGWMLHYFYLTASGRFVGSTTEEVEGIFNSMNASPGTLTFWMVIVVAVGFLICSMGLKNGVERITKWMMLALLAIMVILAVRSISLPGAAEGLEFYLKPDAGKLQEVASGQRHGGGYESVLLHPEPGHRSHGYFRQLSGKEKSPAGGVSDGGGPGYFCGNYLRIDYFSGLLCLRSQS